MVNSDGLFCYLDLLNVIIVMFNAILSYKIPPVVYGEHCTKNDFKKKKKMLFNNVTSS